MSDSLSKTKEILQKKTIGRVKEEEECKTKSLKKNEMK